MLVREDTHMDSASRLIRLKEVRQLTSLSTSTVYRLIAAGKFPQPVKLSERASAWPEAEVRAWIDARIAERPARAAA